MGTLTKKDIKSIALALERATENLIKVCAMLLKKEREHAEAKRVKSN